MSSDKNSTRRRLECDLLSSLQCRSGLFEQLSRPGYLHFFIVRPVREVGVEVSKPLMICWVWRILVVIASDVEKTCLLRFAEVRFVETSCRRAPFPSPLRSYTKTCQSTYRIITLGRVGFIFFLRFHFPMSAAGGIKRMMCLSIPCVSSTHLIRQCLPQVVLCLLQNAGGGC